MSQEEEEIALEITFEVSQMMGPCNDKLTSIVVIPPSWHTYTLDQLQTKNCSEHSNNWVDMRLTQTFYRILKLEVILKLPNATKFYILQSLSEKVSLLKIISLC